MDGPDGQILHSQLAPGPPGESRGPRLSPLPSLARLVQTQVAPSGSQPHRMASEGIDRPLPQPPVRRSYSAIAHLSPYSPPLVAAFARGAPRLQTASATASPGALPGPPAGPRDRRHDLPARPRSQEPAIAETHGKPTPRTRRCDRGCSVGCGTRARGHPPSGNFLCLTSWAYWPAAFSISSLRRRYCFENGGQ